MHYVYLLRSESNPTKIYIGVTANPRARLKKHNEGGSAHTSKHRPWQLVGYHEFESKNRAHDFEKYLKSGSDRAFAKKHFW